MKLPNFLIIGAGKCATTSLAFQLGQHPDVFISTPKEIHFFNKNFDLGLTWYSSFFDTDKALRGEASVTYSNVINVDDIDDVSERIFSTLGDELKLIYMIRDPAVRAYSHYRHDLLNGHLDPSISFLQAIARDSKYVEGGMYFKQLSRFLRYFPNESLHIVLYEDFIELPDVTLKSVFRFLNVDSEFVPSDKQPKNITSQRKRMLFWSNRTGHFNERQYQSINKVS